MSIKCTSLWREIHVEVQTVKIDGPTALLEVEMSKKCAPLWGESRFEVKILKKQHARTTLKAQMRFCVAGASDSAPCQKGTNSEGFVAFPKTMAGVGHVKKIWKDAFPVAGAI